MLNTIGGDRADGRPGVGRFGRPAGPGGTPGRTRGHEGEGTREMGAGLQAARASSSDNSQLKQKLARHYWLVPVDRDLLR
jgi:hypothetical protein